MGSQCALFSAMVSGKSKGEKGGTCPQLLGMNDRDTLIEQSVQPIMNFERTSAIKVQVVAMKITDYFHYERKPS